MRSQISRRSRASRIVATCAALALVAAACNGDDDTQPVVDNDTTTAPVDDTDPVTDPTEDDNDIDDEMPISLEQAVRATIDAGNADYTLRVSQLTLDQLANDDDNGLGFNDDGDTDQSETGQAPAQTNGPDTDEIDGRMQFAEQTRQLSLQVDDEDRDVIIDGTTMYIELGDNGVVDTGIDTDEDAAVGTEDEDAEWGRVMLDDPQQSLAMMTPDLLIALHDPAAVLRAVIPAQTGMVEDDAGTGTDPDGVDDDAVGTDQDTAQTTPGATGATDDNGRRKVVTIQLDQIDDPFVQQLGELTGAQELQVYVWFDTEDDGYVQQMAYDLGAALQGAGPEADPTTDPAEPGTDPGTDTDNGADPGAGTDPAIDNGPDFDNDLDTGNGVAGIDPDNDSATGTEDDDTTPPGDGMTGAGTMTGTGPFVVVELDNVGDAEEIDIPEADEVRDVQFSQIQMQLQVNLLAPAPGAPGTDPGTTPAPGTEPAASGAARPANKH
jgi:hypothetical protein